MIPIIWPSWNSWRPNYGTHLYSLLKFSVQISFTNVWCKEICLALFNLVSDLKRLENQCLGNILFTFTNKIYYTNETYFPNLRLYALWDHLELYYCIKNKNTREEQNSLLKKSTQLFLWSSYMNIWVLHNLEFISSSF